MPLGGIEWRVYDDFMADFTPEDIERLVLKQVQFNDGVRPRSSEGGDHT